MTTYEYWMRSVQDVYTCEFTGFQCSWSEVGIAFENSRI